MRPRANGLLDHKLVHSLGAGRNDTAIGAPGFFGEPIDDVGGHQDLAFGLRQGLALFGGKNSRDGVNAGNESARLPCA